MKKFNWQNKTFKNIYFYDIYFLIASRKLNEQKNVLGWEEYLDLYEKNTVHYCV